MALSFGFRRHRQHLPHLNSNNDDAGLNSNNDEASVASSQSSASVVTSSPSSQLLEAAAVAAVASWYGYEGSNSSSSTSTLRDYIGLSEVSSAPSSSPRSSNHALDQTETDLTLGLGLGRKPDKTGHSDAVAAKSCGFSSRANICILDCTVARNCGLSKPQKVGGVVDSMVAKDCGISSPIQMQTGPLAGYRGSIAAATVSKNCGISCRIPLPPSDALSSSVSKKRFHNRSGNSSLDAARNEEDARAGLKPNSGQSVDHSSSSGVSSIRNTMNTFQNAKLSSGQQLVGNACLSSQKLNYQGIQYSVPADGTPNNSSLGNGKSATDEVPPAKDRVVGWPPVRSYRRSALSSCSKPECDGKSTIYVKVNMDGIPIGRKIDLNAFNSYAGLLYSLEGMFLTPTCGQGVRLLNGSDFILTYEDKEGDWMLVGDVPWDMFVNTVRRLRIMRGSDVSSLGSQA